MAGRNCYNCKWLSDPFVATCCNPDSPNCADYMDRDDYCEEWAENQRTEEKGEDD